MRGVRFLTVDGARICGIALISLVALLLLRQAKPEWAPLLRIAATVVAMGGILVLVSDIMMALSEWTALAGNGAFDIESFGILLRALGIAFLTEVAAAMCRDAGEGTLAMWVELAGKLEILLLAFPLIRTVFEAVAGLLNGG